MLRVVLAAVLVAVAAAQIPAKCSSPRQWEGQLIVTDRFRGHFGAVQMYYSYDETNQRKRFHEIKDFTNASAPLYRGIHLYKEGLEYIWEANNPKTCQVSKSRRPFIPHSVVENATFIADFIYGSTAVEGAGLEVEVWHADLEFNDEKIHWYAHFTRTGCVPIFSEIDFGTTGRRTEQFVDVTVGLHNPNDFIPPPECP
eukprot:m.476139 g.476139  ORF g.476139 m.476139 type:complete len:199 (-) comp20447_c0_seq1:208-804(-)